MRLVEVLLLFFSVLVFVPCVLLLTQVFFAFLTDKKQNQFVDIDESLNHGVFELPSICVLMPAHNEAQGIAAVIRALVGQLDSRARLLVVADNCTDETANIARAAGCSHQGVTVIERQNPLQRGKGHALDFGIRYLEQDPPEVVVIVDADCAVSPGSVELLARTCVATARPVQALDLMRAPLGADVKVQIAEFAWLVKNHVRPLGYKRLGMPCQLMGTGMALSWPQISRAQLNNGHIVEDMKLGIELTKAGSPPLFCTNALVTSYFPLTRDGLHSQRTRWEHGHLGVILTEVPNLLKQSISSANLPLLALALDLCVPPLALLALIIGTSLSVTGAFTFIGVAWAPFLITGLSAAMFGLAVFLAWFGFGRGIISMRQLSGVPLYVLAKIPMYFYFLLKRQMHWVRSKRDGE